MKKLGWMTLCLALALVIASCNNGDNAEKSVQELDENGNEWSGNVRPMYKEDGSVDSTLLAQFEWEVTEYDFGKVTDGELVDLSFKFTNVGQAPLIIEQAEGSCGCTVPERPKEPVAPGQTGEIKVQFNSAGRVGATTKFVTLRANTLPRETKLKITGEVLPKGE